MGFLGALSQVKNVCSNYRELHCLFSRKTCPDPLKPNRITQTFSVFGRENTFHYAQTCIFIKMYNMRLRPRLIKGGRLAQNKFSGRHSEGSTCPRRENQFITLSVLQLAASLNSLPLLWFSSTLRDVIILRFTQLNSSENALRHASDILYRCSGTQYVSVASTMRI